MNPSPLANVLLLPLLGLAMAAGSCAHDAATGTTVKPASPALPEVTAVTAATAATAPAGTTAFATDLPRLDWLALTGDPGCARFRSDLVAVLQAQPDLADHAIGAWSLCALRSGDATAARGAAAHLTGPTVLPEWRQTADWVHWLAVTAPVAEALPAGVPELSAAVLLPVLVARAEAAPAAPWARAAYRRYAAEPYWSDAGRDALAAGLDPAERWELSRDMRRGGLFRQAYANLEPAWRQGGVDDPGAAFARWRPRGTVDERLWFGDLAFAVRRYAVAEAAAAGVVETEPANGEALLLQGRSMARQGQMAKARELWRATVDRVDGTEWEPRIRYRLGLIAEDFGETAAARAAYRRAAASTAHHEDRSTAGFRAGWLAYRAGERAAAVEIWRSELERPQEHVAERRLLYWLSRADSGEGGRRAAAKLARESPLSFYTWLQRRGGAGGAAPVTWTEYLPGRPPLRALDHGIGAGLDRARRLGELGLDPPAQAELWTAYGSAADAGAALTILLAGAGLGDAYGALSRFWDRFGMAFRETPPVYHRDLWEVVYPAPFSAVIEREAARRGIDPQLARSIMREESRFRSTVVSPAGAVGLMQLIPPTAARVARTYGIAYDDERDLLDPRTNVALGSAYLGELLDRFDGELLYAIAAYNAGPTAVDRWVRANGDAGLDVWVEEVSYSETRNYVIKVMRSYIRYHAMDARQQTDAAGGPNGPGAQTPTVP